MNHPVRSACYYFTFAQVIFFTLAYSLFRRLTDTENYTSHPYVNPSRKMCKLRLKISNVTFKLSLFSTDVDMI